MVYARQNEGRELTFDFAEGLLEHNLLMVDRETSSVWSQLNGAAIQGPLQGEPLKLVASYQTTWGFWRRRHPDTQVMVVSEEEGKPYFYRDWDPATPRPDDLPSRHVTSHLGLGLVVDGEAHFFPLAELFETPSPLNLTIAGNAVSVHHSAEGLTAWAEDAANRLLPSVLAYRRAWLDFYPQSRVFGASEEER